MCEWDHISIIYFFSLPHNLPLHFPIHHPYPTTKSTHTSNTHASFPHLQFSWISSHCSTLIHHSPHLPNSIKTFSPSSHKPFHHSLLTPPEHLSSLWFLFLSHRISFHYIQNLPQSSQWSYNLVHIHNQHFSTSKSFTTTPFHFDFSTYVILYLISFISSFLILSP